MAIGNKGKVKIEYSGETPRKLSPNNKNDVLYTLEGQRKFPGQTTKIPSPNITMSGINYPVKGVDNNGNTQMMYPNQDYHFPGADSVTEYPQLAMGGPTASKAEEMLHDGTANGKPLSPAQKRYFGMLAHPKAYGGPTNINLMKNTFSRAWGGSNAANRNYMSLNTPPSMMAQAGGTSFSGDTHMANPYLRIPSDHNTGSELNGFNSPDEDPFEDKKNEFLKWLKGTSMQALHKSMIPHATFYHLPDGNIASHAELYPDEDNKQKKGGWIKGAVNPAHKGYCTPMTKSTCTPARKAFARRAKAHFKEEGGEYTPFEDLNPTNQLSHDHNDFNYPQGGQLTPEDYMYHMGGYDGGGGIGGQGFYNPDMEYAGGGDVHDKPGGSNVGKKHFANGSKRTGPYVGPSGGAPSGSYPVPDIKHARSALSLAHNAPNPGGIKAAVYRKYPQLKHSMGGDMSVPDLSQPFDKLMAHGGEPRWEHTALMEWMQSGGGMNSGSQQDWGFNPAAANISNYFGAYQSAKNAYDPAAAITNFGAAAGTAEMNKSAPQYKTVGSSSGMVTSGPTRDITGASLPGFSGGDYKSLQQGGTSYNAPNPGTHRWGDWEGASSMNEPRVDQSSKPTTNSYGYRDPNFGTYGVNAGRGPSNWLPLNYMTGHHDFLPSPQHRIQGREENLHMPPGSYLSGADLKYGWMDKSSPKNIALHFRNPSGQYGDISPVDLDKPGASRAGVSSQQPGQAPAYNGRGYNSAADPEHHMEAPYTGHPTHWMDNENTPPNQNHPSNWTDPRYPDAGTQKQSWLSKFFGANNTKATPDAYQPYKNNDITGRNMPAWYDPNTGSVKQDLVNSNKRYGGFRYGGYFQDGSQVDPAYMPQTKMQQDTNQTDIYGNDAYNGLSDPASHMSKQDIQSIIPGTGSTAGQTVNLRRKNQYNGEDLANWGLAGINTLTSIVGQRDVLKREQDLKNRTHGDMIFNALPQNMRSRGDYDTNSGAFRPDQDVPTQFMGQPGLRKMGGSSHCNCGGFEDGGEYYLSDDEIENIKAQGGQIDYLD